MARATFSQPSVRPKFGPSGKPGSSRASTVVLVGGGLAMVAGAAVTFTGPGMKILGGIHWFLEFYSGVFSLVALSITVMVGLAATDRIVLMVRHRVLSQAVHRAFATTSMVFLCIHIALKVAEGHASVVDVVVPFVAAHKVLYIGLGTVASYLMFLVTWTGIIRGRFAGSAHPWMWRAMHVSAYASWPIALVHGLEAGRAAKTWVTVSYIVCVILVALALLVRLCVSWGQRLRAPKAQTTGTIKAVGKPVSVSLPPQRALATAADPILDAPDPMRGAPMMTTTVLREAPLPPPRRRPADDDDPFGIERRRRPMRSIGSRASELADEVEHAADDPAWPSYRDAPVSPAPRRSRVIREDGTATGSIPRIREGYTTGDIPRVRDGYTTGGIPRVRDGYGTGETPRVSRGEDYGTPRGYRPMEDAADFPESAYPDTRPSRGAHRSEDRSTGTYPRVERSSGGYRAVPRAEESYEDRGYAPFDSRYASGDRFAAAADERYPEPERYPQGGLDDQDDLAYGHVMPPRSSGRRSVDEDRGRRSRTSPADDLVTSGPPEPPVPDTPPRRRRRSIAELTSTPAEPPMRRSGEEISDEEFWAHMRGEALR